MSEAQPLFDRLGGRPNLHRLLHHFYADVRQHHLLGPVFNAQIENWPHHIDKIADFWSTITGGPAKYNGAMAARHVPLGLKEKHFQAWLGLWEHNCRIWLSADCASELIAIAHQIGARLSKMGGTGYQPVVGGNLPPTCSIMH
ncbi:MAG: group III truncated hemoglobin [Verrucomicrobia bacterium]|nr:group III truncated hemoglobin [Verrucomicrobiota bacterium]